MRMMNAMAAAVLIIKCKEKTYTVDKDFMGKRV
jgi:hypothetical protein